MAFTLLENALARERFADGSKHALPSFTRT
jgi:hypothetical protein